MGGAPLLFGAMSRWLAVDGNTTHGLMLTYEIMLFPVLVAASLIVPGLRTYARDVATVAASVEATEQKKGPGARGEQRQPADEPHPV
jgi:hypothetical protein